LWPQSSAVMLCPQCNYANALGSVVCEKCSTPLPANDETLTDGIVKERPASGGHAATTNRLSPGQLVGQRYQIIRLLGQGGMGAVYEVRDRELDRRVALKVIRADMAESPEAFWRFKQEIILARQITHRNVIRLFDLGQADRIKFITMEYIEGESLRQRLLRKGKLEPREAAQLMAQMCRALEAAHAEGVIHRDLKPRNIMLDKGGRAYVMDFGLARSMSASGITHIGGFIGTLDYMSPEQAKDLPLDARSDLFSAGIIFYEMLTGIRPFDASAPTGEPGRRASEPPRPPHEVDNKVPSPLSETAMKCLEFDPQRRFATARELLQQIELWLGTQGESVATITTRPRSPLYLKVIGTGLAAALVVTAVALR
jgi:serine/threonine protein kinase